MIQITRAQARQLRAVLRKSLPPGSARSYHPPLSLTAGERGLCVRVHNPEAAIEWTIPGPRSTESMTLPSAALDDFEGRHESFVDLTQKDADNVQACWQDGGVPQFREYAVVPADKLPPFPAEPEACSPVNMAFFKAFDDAVHTAAKEAIRLATTRVQLRGGTGEIVATDARQLLVQRGFEFPFKEDVLIPAVGVFGCRELNAEGTVTVGRSEAHVCVKVGAWTFHLAIDKDGRFPRYETVIPANPRKGTSMHLAPDDAPVLLHALPRMPGLDELFHPVTVDLNGHVAIRAKDDAHHHTTELRLDRSQIVGPVVRFATDREHLARAVRLGFTEIHVTSADAAITCRDSRRTYVWMPLDKKSALPHSKNVVLIGSPASNGDQAHTNHHPRSETTMSTPTTNGQAEQPAAEPAQANGEEGQSSGGYGALIAETEALRDALKDAFTRSSRLVTALRRHRKQSKIVQTTLASLRQLQEIEH